MVQVVTTRNSPSNPRGRAKPFTWSYSRLKNFNTCPLRHQHVDLLKDFKEEPSEHLEYGEAVHAMLAKRIGKGVPIPALHEQLLEPWAQRVLKGVDGSQGAPTVLVEQKLALTQDLKPCEFFDRQAWFRAVCDVVKLHGPVALVLDWKTGRIVEDSVQLSLAAACVFAHHPSVQKIRSEFVWLKEDAETTAVLSRDDLPEVWRAITPQLEAMRTAHDTGVYPPAPGRLCRSWCPVSTCRFHGVSHG